MRWTFLAAAVGVGMVVGCQKSGGTRCACGHSTKHAVGSPTAADAFRIADASVLEAATVVTGIDHALAICAENLAHAEETAFRATRVTVAGDGTLMRYIDPVQGALEDTRRDLDLGIQGHGYFKVKVRGDGQERVAYTRNGHLFINGKGELVVGLLKGCPLEPAIRIPDNATDISINSSGTVEVRLPGATDVQRAGTIRLSQFANPNHLSPHTRGLYLETKESGPPNDADPSDDGPGIVLQGFLESSNVNVEREQMRMEYLRNWRAALVRSATATTTQP